MQALILAGGEGTRLRPLTNAISKPVLPLAGRPHIAYVIDWLGGHGVDDVVVSCGHLGESVKAALEGITGPRLRFAEEPEPRGTAGAIRFAEDHLEDRFFVINGDVLCDLDLGALVEQHESRRGARATIALHPVEDPSAYGLVRRGDDGEVKDFLEKPDSAETDVDGGEINAGAYLLERSVLEEIPPGRPVSIETEVFPKLVGNGLYGCRLEGYWIDIGTPARFLQANWDILEGRVDTVTGQRLDGDGLLIEDGAEINDAVVMGPAVIAGEARLSAGARVGPRAVLGRGCAIGERAQVEGSVLLAECRVGEEATVRDAILAQRVEVPAGGAVGPDAVIGEGEVLSAS
jgi:mannose-1-phosphate guanylyltransferase